MLICSPHCDDATLSLGAAIAAGRLGKVKTAIFFSRSKFTRLTPGTGDEKAVTALRAKEERAAAAICGYKPFFLHLPEPFARPGYTLENLRDEDVDPLKDSVFAATLAAALRLAQTGEPLLFPLAAGGHIDHRILAAIGKALCGRARVAGFYEDIPYTALWGRTKTDAFARTQYRALITRRLPLESGKLTLKRDALRCYKSQFTVKEIAELSRKAKACGGEAIWLTRIGEKLFSSPGQATR